MNVRFFVPSGRDSEKSYTRRLPIVVGRSDEAKFRIPLDSVSRKHCEIFEKDGRVFVRDLGSSNGTQLDGEPIAISVATFVRPGSTIRVAQYPIRIEYEPAASGDDDETASVRMKRPEPATPGIKTSVNPAEGENAQSSGKASSRPPVAEAPRSETSETPPTVADTFAAPSGDLPPAAPADLEVSEPEPLEITAEETRGEAGFGFLEAAAAPESAPDDEHLGDFFKSLE
jgi:predicted component of type VI protein secretion system